MPGRYAGGPATVNGTSRRLPLGSFRGIPIMPPAVFAARLPEAPP
jgi:hypothetical protein